MAGDGDPERVRGEVVTDRYPAVLGITPILGRPFTDEEAQHAGAAPVALIGHGLWTRRYGGDPGVLGRVIQINGNPHTVVGVLPRGFQGLSGDADVWVPLAVVEPSQLTEAQSHSYHIVAQRRPDVAEGAAVAALRVHGAQVRGALRPDRSPAGRPRTRCTPRAPTRTSAAARSSSSAPWDSSC